MSRRPSARSRKRSSDSAAYSVPGLMSLTKERRAGWACAGRALNFASIGRTLVNGSVSSFPLYFHALSVLRPLETQGGVKEKDVLVDEHDLTLLLKLTSPPDLGPVPPIVL